MFGKILVANRGEIAIRAYRAARELGARTVAVYPVEDRHSTHRAAADESRQIGEPGHPVQAYLSIDEIIAAARATGADAIYPGYGFLAENAEFAGACAKAGITFIGPSPEALVLAGDKVRAVAAAREAGLPVLASSASITDPAELPAAASGMTFPLFVKAVGGGGGRGMRRVERPAELPSAFAVASREAAAAFGNPAVFLEQAVCQPRHVEVQILADGHGDVVHLFERDCSLQRRHQKVIEMAPAPDLPAELRDRICADAVAFAHQIGYEGAGTVEFLLDAAGNHVFIEMNPRIQVEHTVTEEVTGIDLVRAQLRIAAGETLADLGLKQDSITISGAALQCRVTTEDPAHDFRPSTGRVGAYRPAGGPGVRIDSATCLGAEVTAHFDSLLAKVTCRAENRAGAIVRARRALAEFEVGGVTTNIGFLRAVLADPDFLAGRVHTGFLEEHPDLLTGSATIPDTGDRIGGLLRYLLSVTINRPHGPAPVTTNPREKLPPLDLSQLPVPGSRERLRRLGPARFAAALREQAALAVTDTTFRDAHQSLLATRVRTAELLDVAGHVARLAPELLSVEAWGGATYDVALRFLHEDPWDRLAALREAIPNICLQMLLRGRNTVGYTPYPPLVTSAFIDEAVRAGIDIFRVFDALNNVAQMRPAIDAIRETGVAVAEVALCYTGDLGDPDEHLYTLDYYLRLAEQIVEA
ncbi:MAG TPA: pyruvate carboxylase, partial [Pseudonocardiaceae bacterium]